MPKLYIFGIGGTGARVLRQCVHLWAAGVGVKELQDWEFVPVLIDRDLTNGDLERTTQLLAKYTTLRTHLENASTHKEDLAQFKHKVRRYRDATENESKEADGGDNDALDFILELPSARQEPTLKTAIGYNNLNSKTQALMRLLFDNGETEVEKNHLEMQLDVGFKGAPNLGAIVMHELVDSPTLRKICDGLSSDDRIMIIGSCFGGTGASGAPLLSKIIREDNNLPNKEVRQKIAIGFIAMLPYFAVSSNQGGSIQSDSFIAKAKAALRYYYEQKDVDLYYYIGDEERDPNHYSYAEGSKDQKNPAHFAEFAAALAVLDFPVSSGLTSGGTAKAKHFALESQQGRMELASLGKFNEKDMSIKLELSKYFLLSRFLQKSGFLKMKGNPWVAQNKITNVEEDVIFRHIIHILEDFEDCLDDFNRIAPNFSPFNLGMNAQIKTAITNAQPSEKSSWSKYSLQDFDDFNQFMIEANPVPEGDWGSKVARMLVSYNRGADKALNFLSK